MNLLSLTEVKQTSTLQSHHLKEPCAVVDAVAAASATAPKYYVIAQAIYAYMVAAVAIVGSPMFARIIGSKWTGTVDDLYTGSYILGSGAGLVGPMCDDAATTAAAFGWVQTLGDNVVALTTDGNVTAGQLLYATSAAGTWGGHTVSQDIAATAGTAYNARSHHHGGFAWVADSSATILAVGYAWIETFAKAWNGL